MSRDLEQYHFDPYGGISDIEHLHCMRIRLSEDKPTVQDVQHMLHCLYAQRNVKPENIFMSPQDLRDMSYTLMRESGPCHSYRYFADNDINENNRFSSGCIIKRVWYGADPPVRVYPFKFLDHRFVIVGFFPIRINEPPKMDWASLLTAMDKSL
jgi:hypothetical protein